MVEHSDHQLKRFACRYTQLRFRVECPRFSYLGIYLKRPSHCPACGGRLLPESVRGELRMAWPRLYALHNGTHRVQTRPVSTRLLPHDPRGNIQTEKRPSLLDTHPDMRPCSRRDP